MLKLIEWEPQVKAEMEDEILYTITINGGGRKNFSCFNSEIKKQKQKTTAYRLEGGQSDDDDACFPCRHRHFFLFSIYTVVGIRVED